MADETELGAESSAVQLHLRIVQGVIGRMADNSRSCKVWCAALVSAVLVLVARTDGSHHVFIALVPALLLACLDVYYLALERAFRSSYAGFVERLHAGELRRSDLYTVEPPRRIEPRSWISGLRSHSVWIFYGAIALLVVAAWLVLWLVG